MIEFNLNRIFRNKEERKGHLREKIQKKIAYNKEKGIESSFFSIARRSMQEVMPADKFEIYATIAKEIEEKYNIKLTLGKDGNTDISTNRYGEHSWYIKYREDTKKEREEKEELSSRIEKLNLKIESFNKETIKIFAPIKELTKTYLENRKDVFTHLSIPGDHIYRDIDSIEKIEELILRVSNNIEEAKIDRSYERWNIFYVYLEKYLEELREIKSKIEKSENYLQYKQEYGKTNIGELENEKNQLYAELDILESIPNTISIKDHFAVGQGDIQFIDGDSEYYHYYQYKTAKGDYIDKTIVLDFDNKNEIININLFFINKAYNDNLKELSGEDYIKEFQTLEECKDYLKNID
jgi:hypothetical protein